jgi:uncharacterized FlaG/YvyC family protein
VAPAREGAEKVEITKIIKAVLPQPNSDRPKVEKSEPSLRASDDSANNKSQSQAPAVSEKELIQAARELEVRFNLSVKMVTDEATGREVVRIFSKDGERLLRQMPPDQVLRMADQARQGTLENILNSMV